MIIMNAVTIPTQKPKLKAVSLISSISLSV
jgi:hypothetical protein